MTNAITGGATAMTVDTTNEPDTTRKSTVVQFPSRILRDVDVENIEATIESAKTTKRLYADDLAEFAMEQLTSIFSDYGIDINSPRIPLAYTINLEQALQATACKFWSLEHPIDEIIATHYREVTQDDLDASNDDSDGGELED